MLLLELALEKESDQHLNNYRPVGGGSGGKGYQGSRPGQGTTPKHAHARTMENVKELFWCDARHEQGHLQHASDCEQRDCFVVQGKQQEKNTGAKAKLPDHYRCTITCAFCGKRKHYEDECYHKQRPSAKLKRESSWQRPKQRWRQRQRQRLRQGQVERTWSRARQGSRWTRRRR